MTGCFQWLALHITRMSRGNGLALFFLYYGLSSVLTIFTSNDVSIMALTVRAQPCPSLRRPAAAQRQTLIAGVLLELRGRCAAALPGGSLP